MGEGERGIQPKYGVDHLIEGQRRTMKHSLNSQGRVRK